MAHAFRAHKSGFRKLLSSSFNLYSTLAFSPEHSSPPNIYFPVLFKLLPVFPTKIEAL